LGLGLWIIYLKMSSTAPTMPIATSTSQTSVGASLPSYDTLDSVVVPKPPTYSTVPYDNEETVAFTPRLGSSDSSPHGNYVKNWPQATLILIDQEEETRLPTYGRGGRIAGELALVSTERVVRVSVKVFSSTLLAPCRVALLELRRELGVTHMHPSKWFTDALGHAIFTNVNLMNYTLIITFSRSWAK